jgi:hypothetical protein
VFVVVVNDSTPRAPVTVSASAVSSNGRATVTGQSVIGALAAGETEAAMVRLAIPADDTVATVRATATGSPAAGAINPLTVSSASFTSDPIEPMVNVTVSAIAPTAAVVLAVCYQGPAVVGGGVAQSALVRAGAPMILRLAAALTENPATCRGFAYRA